MNQTNNYLCRIVIKKDFSIVKISRMNRTPKIYKNLTSATKERLKRLAKLAQKQLESIYCLDVLDMKLENIKELPQAETFEILQYLLTFLDLKLRATFWQGKTIIEIKNINEHTKEIMRQENIVYKKIAELYIIIPCENLHLLD